MPEDNLKRAVSKAKGWKATSGIDPEVQSSSPALELQGPDNNTENISLYHGTSSKAAEKIRQSGFWDKFDVSLYGGGIYATSDVKQAKHYSEMKGGKTGQVIELSINPNELSDLGQFPKGNRKAIDDLYTKAKKLRQEKKSLLIRGHERYGDLVILDPELATRSMTQAKSY